MSEQMYNTLLPHKLMMDAAYLCIDKHTELPSFPRSLVNLMVDYWDEISGTKPTDRTCGACVTEAMKEIIKRFSNYGR